MGPKRLIVANIESTACNMRCSYCYVGAVENKPVQPPVFSYSVDHMARALSKGRLGGVCLIHLVSSGETLLFKETVPFTRSMLEEGHFVYLITNMVLSEKIQELLSFPSTLLRRLIFHPSFHYAELQRLGKMDEYFNNLRAALKAGCSIAPSIVLNEEYVPRLDEIAALWMKEMGDLPQVTPIRSYERSDVKVVFPGEQEFIDKGAFRSTSFKVSKQLMNVKRTEFCYAGDWGLMINLLNGDASRCMSNPASQNIFKDLRKPIRFDAVGDCKAPWCICGPTFLALGMIPELEIPTLAECRGRPAWLNAEATEFLSGRLYQTNTQYGRLRKWSAKAGLKEKSTRLRRKIKSNLRKLAGRK